MTPRTQKSTRKFGGKEYIFADWAPSRAEARIIKNKWGARLGANVRVVKMRHGYNIYVRT